MIGPFVGPETWPGLLDNPAASVSFPIIRQLTESGIEGPLLVFGNGSGAERRVALGILRALARRSHELTEVPWKEATRAAFVGFLRELTRMDQAAARPERGGAPARFLWAGDE